MKPSTWFALCVAFLALSLGLTFGWAMGVADGKRIYNTGPKIEWLPGSADSACKVVDGVVMACYGPK